MIKQLLFATLFAATLTPSFASDGVYIEFKMSQAGGKESKIVGSMKLYGTLSGNSRSEMNMEVPMMPGGKMKMVTISKASEPGKIYMIYDESKTYSVSDMSKYKNKTNELNTGEYEVTVIGDETVNGFKSKHILVKHGRHNQDFWLTKDIPNYEQYNKFQSNKYMSDNKMVAAFKAKGVEGFPARIVAEEKEGAMQMDLVKVTKQDVPASMLEIPAGYKEGNAGDEMRKQMNMPSMEQIKNMTPEQREKWMQEMKDKYSKSKQ